MLTTPKERRYLAPDAVLIRKCIEGDQEAWAELIRRYERLIYSIARVFSNNQEDAADIFQQVCLELYRCLKDLRDIAALPAWLITVTRRKGIVAMVARRRNEPPDDIERSVRSEIAVIERQHSVEQAVEQLPTRCRNLLKLLYYSGDKISYVTVADKMAMPVASIGPTRARCLAKLKDILGGYDNGS